MGQSASSVVDAAEMVRQIDLGTVALDKATIRRVFAAFDADSSGFLDHTQCDVFFDAYVDSVISHSSLPEDQRENLKQRLRQAFVGADVPPASVRLTANDMARRADAARTTTRGLLVSGHWTGVPQHGNTTAGDGLQVPQARSKRGSRGSSPRGSPSPPPGAPPSPHSSTPGEATETVTPGNGVSTVTPRGGASITTQARPGVRAVERPEFRPFRPSDGKTPLQQSVERRLNGAVSCVELSTMLSRLDVPTVTARMTLQRALRRELQKNHVLDGQLVQLDLKISLMITNKGTTQDLGAKKREAWLAKLADREKKKQAGQQKEKYELPAGHLEAYGELFWLLQTEPKYLAKSLFLLQPTQVEAFLDSTLITLFGEAFSPREECLLVALCRAVAEHQVLASSSVQDLLADETVLAHLLTRCNQRMQGMVYLRIVLPEVIKVIVDDRDANFDTDPIACAADIGKSFSSAQDALKSAAVTKELEKRTAALVAACSQFLNQLYNTLDKLPYGMRWICKMLGTRCEQLPRACFDSVLKQDDHSYLNPQRGFINRDILSSIVPFLGSPSRLASGAEVTAQVVFDLFVSRALHRPESFKVTNKTLSAKQRNNLMVVHRVLAHALHARPFGAHAPQEWHLQPLNPFLELQHDEVLRYLEAIPEVPESEDYLLVSPHEEMGSRDKPTIFVGLSEAYTVHELVAEQLHGLVAFDDPMRVVLADLGAAPSSASDAGEPEVQLTLQPRLNAAAATTTTTTMDLYTDTKMLLMMALAGISSRSWSGKKSITDAGKLTLSQLLHHGAKWAKKQKNSGELAAQIDRVVANLKMLDSTAGLISHGNCDGDYASFVRDVAMDVACASTFAGQMRKEMPSLQSVLAKLQKQSAFTEEQLVEYDKYLQDALKKQYEGKKPKALHKPQKFSYRKMVQMGVILDSEIPFADRQGCKLVWHVGDTPGVFTCTVVARRGQLGAVAFRLDDLLERHFTHEEAMEIDVPQLVLSVDMALYIISKYILTH